MNRLLEQYVVDVDYPEVSGIEHVQMLETRSKSAAAEAQPTSVERQALAAADFKLATHADTFFGGLSRFVNLVEERHQRQVSLEEWWWYLDVLVKAPALPHHATPAPPVPA